MRCPFCQYRDSRVTDSRATGDGIRRRRECTSCGQRFTTIEAVQLSTVQVVKRDGRREDFDPQKLTGGLRKACAKRAVAVGQIDAIVAEVEARIAADGRAEVPSTLIGEMAMEALRGLDHIAYIRFASVYRPFTDVEALQEALRTLEEGRAHATEQTQQLALIEDAPERELVGV